LKIGILFGGPSREREISFAGGRTVYDNLDKTLFEPVPIFIDSIGNFILLDWQYIYKGTIRDFYPPVAALPPSPNGFQVYIESLGDLTRAEQDAIIAHVGRRITLDELPDLIDFAFLTLHGEFGEDGQIQGLLDALRIPYSGSGIRPSTIAMDKSFQKKLMAAGGFPCPKIKTLLSVEDLKTTDLSELGSPIVIRPANQGSSIGVRIIPSHETDKIQKAVEYAFFQEKIDLNAWACKTDEERVRYVRDLSDIRSGLGFPASPCPSRGGGTDAESAPVLFHPEELLKYLNDLESDTPTIVHAYPEVGFLQSHLSEQKVILEEFISGKEFSCVVVRLENGETVALPPTEIVKGGEVFDYRSKYLPGLSRKITPINLPHDQINSIRSECERLFAYLEFDVYARIDGFIKADGTIFLNDPNTTSGMLPSSFFFHQAAEIGLNPSQFLTYIIRTSMQARIETAMVINPKTQQNLAKLDEAVHHSRQAATNKIKVGVILGGYSSERHISVESGRNIYEKLASSAKYAPIPIFLIGDATQFELYEIPINLLLKDNADDIRDKVLHFSRHAVIAEIKTEAQSITDKYAAQNVIFEPRHIPLENLKSEVDAVFLGLHGRPGEDGNLQQHLERMGIPFNGSPSWSAAVTIDKYETLQRLKAAGMIVTDQILVQKADFLKNEDAVLDTIEAAIPYPLIAKPMDDGCSSAVKKIKKRDQMRYFLQAIFRESEHVNADLTEKLGLKPKEEFPAKTVVLIEKLISPEGAKHFLEITGGLLTQYNEKGERVYTQFEPSETLADGEILSLEEKFLAGEGQNITPARYDRDPEIRKQIADQVRADLQRAAEILGVEGYARIDAFVRVFDDNRAETIVIEVNSLPGMTPATCIFHQCALDGYKPYEFIDAILEFGKARVAGTL
jgi:UDP-N-acetylmuramate--alanine ligase